MMNATVARIVELMFEDLEMNDEVQAIHDEVMNNCQERYEDLVACGMSEDEATAAVVESLKGMDEVLAGYPKKMAETAAESEEDEEEPENSHYSFSAGMVSSIVAETLDSDVEFTESDDDLIHVESENKDLEVRLENGRLSIQYPGGYKREKGNAKFQAKDFHINMEDGFDLRTLMDKLSIVIRDAAGNVRVKIGGGKDVTIRLPRGLRLDSVTVATTSGDVEIQDMDDLLHARRVTITSTSGNVTLENNVIEELSVNTTSGDIEINNEEHHTMRSLRMRTTSGDIDGEIFADRCEVNTISGDMELEGRYAFLNLRSTSGDATMRADVQDMRFHSVSGDMELTFDSREIKNIQGHTVSGDVEVRLPGGMTVSELKTQSTSGDSNCSLPHGESGVRINISTASGDIDVR